jgi:rRNA-processing protein FCF1
MAGALGPPAVVLDTNVLLLPFTQGTRLEEELEALLGAHTLHVPTSVVSELKMLTQNRGATGRAAKAALAYAQRFASEPTGLMGDDGILQVARRLGGIVATNDRTLQAECERSGLRVVVARETGRLAFRGSGSA